MIQIPGKEDKEDILAEDDQYLLLEMQGYEKTVQQARNTLYFMGAIILVGELISAAALPGGLTPLIAGIALFLAAIFAGLALLTKIKPYTAIVIALWALAIYGSGWRGAIGGIILKIVVLVYLFRTLKDAKSLQDLKNSMR